MASSTSKAFPIAKPNGWSISEITAIVLRPICFPIETISVANSLADSVFFMKAPSPTLTSKTIASAPEAIFLLIMLDAIKETLSTVAVTSLKAYNFLSAGAKSPVWPPTAILIVLTLLMNFSVGISTEKPLKASNLSMVPPVCPRPLPDILATGIPNAATIGVSTKVVVSPTPPVLCLSTLTP